MRESSFCWLSLPFLIYLGGNRAFFCESDYRGSFRGTDSGCSVAFVFGFANLAQRTEVVIFNGFRGNLSQASVAQLAEQLICNQQVVGSSPSASSSIGLRIPCALQPVGDTAGWRRLIGGDGGLPRRAKLSRHRDVWRVGGPRVARRACESN